MSDKQYDFDFLKAFSYTMLWEVGPHFDFNDPQTQQGIGNRKCGLVNHSNDPGGLTKFGISQKRYPNEDIANLTMYNVMDLYEVDFWVKGKCDQLPSRINSVHFDAYVNHSARKANKMLQAAVGCSVIDGIVGPNTIKIANAMVDDHGAEYVIEKMLDNREAYFKKIANRNDKLKTFLTGWMNRVNGLRKAVKQGEI